jgi:hypothetical protein
VTQSILIVLYAGITVKMLRTTRLNFILVIAALLSVSCVTWIFVCYCKLHELKLLGSLLWFANLISYDFALWMFTMRYWVLSKVLGLIVKN